MHVERSHATQCVSRRVGGVQLLLTCIPSTLVRAARSQVKAHLPCGGQESGGVVMITMKIQMSLARGVVPP